jgi:O-antigen/teichoic acid export membrane protein
VSIARHTAYNLAGYLAPVLISVLTVPFYLRIVGLERYGLLAICWTLLGFMGFLNLGMGPAVAQRLAVERDSAPENRSQIFWSAAALSTGMALIGGLAILFVGPLYFATVHVADPQLRTEIAEGLPWLAATFVISLAGGVFSGALQGRQWFGLLNTLGIATSTAIALVPLAAAVLIGPRLPVLLAATFAVNAASYLLQFVVCRRAVPLAGRPSVSRSAIGKLFSYGSWMTLLSLLTPIVMLSDRLAIGSRLGSAAVPIYVVPYNLVSRVVALPASLSSASLPKLAAAKADEEQALLTLGLQLLLASLAPICVIGNLLIGPFLHLWVGDAIAAQGSIVGSILIFGFWMHGIGHIPSTVLLGRGRPDIIAKLFLLYLVPYFVLLFALLHIWGVVGAAVAWAVRASMDLFLFWFARTGRRPAFEIAACTLIVLASSASAILFDWHKAGFWIVMGALLLISLAAAFAIVPEGLLGRLGQRARLGTAPPQQGDAAW